MGCTQSKIDNEEAVSRCKDRRNFMKAAVTARNAFASAHTGYGVVLKNIGAALSDYAQGEAPPPQMVVGGGGGVNGIGSEPRPPPPPPMADNNLPPPPPPLPSFSPMPPLQRAVTMPALSQPVSKLKGIDGIDEEEEEEEGGESGGSLRPRNRKGKEVEDVGSEASETPLKTPMPPPPPPDSKMAWDYFFNVNMPGSLDELEEEDDEDYTEERDENEHENFNKTGGNGSNVDDEDEFKTPEKLVRGSESQMEEITPEPEKERHFLQSNTAPAGTRGAGNGGMTGGSSSANSVDLLKVLSDIDDHFLKASESAQEVSKMLEATRLHYHSNFADNRGEWLTEISEPMTVFDLLVIVETEKNIRT